MAKHTTQELSSAVQVKEVEYTPLGESIPIKISIAQLKMAGIVRPTRKGVMPDDGTILTFMLRCRAQGLNPFAGDAFLIGFDSADGQEFSLLTAIQSLYKRAELSGQYDGMESGVIVESSDELHDLEGDFVPKGTTLRGAWAKCYRKDQSRPTKERINLEPFKKSTSLWHSNPQGQIVKCAEASVLRRAFPTTCGGLFIADEMNSDGNTIVAQAEHKPKRVTEVVRSSQPAETRPEPQNEAAVDGALPTEDEVLAGLRHELENSPGVVQASTIAAAYTDRNPPLEERIYGVLQEVKKAKGWS